MNNFKKLAMFGLLIVFAIVINACSAEPTKDIKNLKQKYSQINAEEAQGYTPDLFNTIQNNIVAIDQDVTSQQTKGGMFRNYSNTKELITKVNTDLIQLETEIANAKIMAKGEVAQLIAKLDGMVVEAEGALAKATTSRTLKAKVPGLKTELETIKAAIEQIKKDAKDEKFFAAKATVLDIEQKFVEVYNSLALTTH